MVRIDGGNDETSDCVLAGYVRCLSARAHLTARHVAQLADLPRGDTYTNWLGSLRVCYSDWNSFPNRKESRLENELG